MGEDQLELNRFERISMHMYTQFGAIGLIALCTLFSILASIVATIPLISMVADDTTTADDLKNPLTYIHIAIVIPLIIAPICCSVFTRLLMRLNAAYQRVAELSTTDPLTGSANRRGFMDVAAQNIHALHEAESCIVGMIDLDKFKLVNDTHGHQIGDEALTCVASCLSTVIGNFGLVGRLGGDEFALIALGSADDLQTLSKRLQSECTNVTLTNGANVSCSIGIVTLKNPETLEEALVRADSLLYTIKSDR